MSADGGKSSGGWGLRSLASWVTGRISSLASAQGPSNVIDLFPLGTLDDSCTSEGLPYFYNNDEGQAVTREGLLVYGPTAADLLDNYPPKSLPATSNAPADLIPQHWARAYSEFPTPGPPSYRNQ
jgi:hypothetical protein